MRLSGPRLRALVKRMHECTVVGRLVCIRESSSHDPKLRKYNDYIIIISYLHLGPTIFVDPALVEQSRKRSFMV